MENKHSTYIKVEAVYLSSILTMTQNIVAEALFNIDFEKKETTIYSVSNSHEGLGLKLYIVLKNVTYVNENPDKKNVSFIVETTLFLEKIKTFAKTHMIMISTDDLQDYVYLESNPVYFVEYNKKESNIKHQITNICEKAKSSLNHKFDPSEYPIQDDPKYYCQFLLCDLMSFNSFMKNSDTSESMRIQFDDKTATFYINNTIHSPTFRTMSKYSSIESRIIKMVSLSNMQKLCGLKKITKEVSIKVHKINPNKNNYISEQDKKDNSFEDKIFDINALVIHPLCKELNYDLTFIIDCNSLN
jgi:hypothetical protein